MRDAKVKSCVATPSFPKAAAHGLGLGDNSTLRSSTSSPGAFLLAEPGYPKVSFSRKSLCIDQDTIWSRLQLKDTPLSKFSSPSLIRSFSQMLFQTPAFCVLRFDLPLTQRLKPLGLGDTILISIERWPQYDSGNEFAHGLIDSPRQTYFLRTAVCPSV